MAMNDKQTTIRELRDAVKSFVDDREWFQFHTPKDTSMAISVEASELVEKFLWMKREQSFEEVKKNREEIEQELADVVVTLITFARAAKIDVAKAVKKKMEHNAKKFPLEKTKGRGAKWERT